MKHDPIKNPKSGDIIRLGGTYGGTFIEILDSFGARLAPNDVAYIIDGVESAISLGPYRKWAATAEAIKVAI